MGLVFEPSIIMIPLSVAKTTDLSNCVMLSLFVHTSREMGWREENVPLSLTCNAQTPSVVKA